MTSDSGKPQHRNDDRITMLRNDLGSIVVLQKDLPLQLIDRDIVGAAYLQIFDRAVDAFYTGELEECHMLSKTVLNITWEQLNTGHWKDINLTWRYCYTIVSLIKAFTEYGLSNKAGQSSEGTGDYTVLNAVKTCDMGLLMGAPILDNILAKVVKRLQLKYENQVHSQKRKAGSSSDVAKLCHKVPRTCATTLSLSGELVPEIECPSLDYFKAHHMDIHVPVVLNGCMDFWPARSSRQWTLDYIKAKAGCRTVPIEIGSKYTEDSWSQKLMTVEKFIEEFIENPNSSRGTGYLAQHQLFEQIPELQDDICVPSYCGLGDSDDVDINTWFGPEGTISPLHQDPKHNLLCQIIGEKYIRLYSTEHTARLYPHKNNMFGNTSQVDAENPDLDAYPDFAKAPYQECILRPGQMLYIPPKYWHYVRSLALSFSVSFWWEGFNAGGSEQNVG